MWQRLNYAAEDGELEAKDTWALLLAIGVSASIGVIAMTSRIGNNSKHANLEHSIYNPFKQVGLPFNCRQSEQDAWSV